MANLQIIETLCDLVEKQARIIRHQAASLDQLRALTKEEKAAVREVEEGYMNILGAGEYPDDLPDFLLDE